MNYEQEYNFNQCTIFLINPMIIFFLLKCNQINNNVIYLMMGSTKIKNYLKSHVFYFNLYIYYIHAYIIYI